MRVKIRNPHVIKSRQRKAGPMSDRRKSIDWEKDHEVKELKAELSKYNQNVIWAFENGYCVEEDGTVISPNGKTLKLLERKREGKTSYYTFSIQDKTIYVHRLQAYQKFGMAALEKGIEVRHMDSNSLNNSFGNLELGTKTDNAQDRPKEQRVALAKHAASFNRKLTDQNIEEIKQSNLSNIELAEKYSVSRQRISQIRKMK